MASRRASPGILLGLTALAAAGRLAFVWAPNVAPTFFVAFIAGAAYGARAGAFVGAMSMLVTNVVLSGLHPVLLVNSAAMALVGVAGAAAARVIDLGQREDGPRAPAAAAAAFVGVASLVLFSVVADALTYALFYRNGVAGLATLVVRGLAFNVIPAVVNGIVFASATYPVLRALRKAGLTRRDVEPLPA